MEPLEGRLCMSLAGPWFVDGNAHVIETVTQVGSSPSQVGSSLSVENGAGAITSGIAVTATRVEVNGLASNGTTSGVGLGVEGQLVPIDDGQRIVWPNGTYWDQINLTGVGFINGNLPVTVQQYGTTLVFTNEHNSTVLGGFGNNPGQVVAYGWGNLVGQIQLTAEGYNIAWANGTTWSFVRLSGMAGSVNEFFINGTQPTYLTQNQNQLTFTNERGNISNGWVVNSNTVYAQGWNLFGTLYATPVGVEIDWWNGTKWDEPRLGGGWSISNKPTQVYEGSLPGMSFFLTFINEAGNVSYGYLAGSNASAAEVVAQGWGNLVGYVIPAIDSIAGSDLWIAWTNDTTWHGRGPL